MSVYAGLRFCISFIYLFLLLFSCPHFPLTTLPCPIHPHLPHSILPPPLALSMDPLYMFLDDRSPSFLCYPSPTSPLVTVSLFLCLYVFIFYVSSLFLCLWYILLTCLFSWLGSTYRWNHMAFVFHCLAYFTSYNVLHPVPSMLWWRAEVPSFFLLCSIPLCECTNPH